jgi:hypothetical protein
MRVMSNFLGALQNGFFIALIFYQKAISNIKNKQGEGDLLDFDA